MTALLRRPVNSPVMTDDFDRLFDSLFGTFADKGVSAPYVDILENKDGYVLEADLPGTEEKDLDIKVENDLLTISAGRKDFSSDKKDDERYLLRERRACSYKRSFTLPKDADTKKIEASFKNGQLTLAIGKKEESKPVTIKVNGN